MTEIIKKQILFIRDTSITNMLDIRIVQHLANEYGFRELVVYLEEHRKEYANYIMTGRIK